MTITERYNGIITNVYKYNEKGNIINRTYTYGKNYYTYNDDNNVQYSSNNNSKTLEYTYDNYKNPFKDIFFFTVLGELIEYPIGFGENNITQVNFNNLNIYIVENQYNKERYPTVSKKLFRER